jgi:hypothetical protein
MTDDPSAPPDLPAAKLSPGEGRPAKPRHAWQLSEPSEVATADSRKDLVDTLQRELTQQGIKTIEHYAELAKGERDEAAQPLVQQYLERRLTKHLEHLHAIRKVVAHGGPSGK